MLPDVHDARSARLISLHHRARELPPLCPARQLQARSPRGQCPHLTEHVAVIEPGGHQLGSERTRVGTTVLAIVGSGGIERRREGDQHAGGFCATGTKPLAPRMRPRLLWQALKTMK